MFLKKSAIVVGVLLTVTACSPKEKANTNDSNPASAVSPASSPISAPVSTASTPVASSTPETSSKSASAITFVEPKTTKTAQTQQSTANASPALQKDLTLLFKTLNDIDNKTGKQQQELAQKMQTAQDPKVLTEVYQEISKQLTNQKSTLNNLKFEDPRMNELRQKMISSIDDNQNMIQQLQKKPDANPETDPAIAKIAEEGQKSAIEARDMLMQLVQEAGINPQDMMTSTPK